VAVLAAAVDEYEKYIDAKDSSSRRRFAEVEGWFAADDARWPFSFAAICEALGLDLTYSLRVWRHGRLAGREQIEQLLGVRFVSVNVADGTQVLADRLGHEVPKSARPRLCGTRGGVGGGRGGHA